MENKPLPILRELPDELVGERIVMRPRRGGEGAAVWEAVEESREQLRPWLPWVEGTRSADDCEAVGRRAWARWLLREDLMVGIWDRDGGRCLGGSGELRDTQIFAMTPEDYALARAGWTPHQ